MSKPFETTFATLRRGAASMEATEAMQQVVKSVYETGKTSTDREIYSQRSEKQKERRLILMTTA